MKPNVGNLDRMARITIGVILLVLASIDMIGAWGWLGLLLIATGTAKFCPLYPLLRISTCPRDTSPPPAFHVNLPESFQNEPKDK
jgi:hypothetical protein